MLHPLMPRRIRWRRLDHPALEDALLERGPRVGAGIGWRLTGRVAGDLPDGRSYTIRYRVRCDEAWVTREATVELQLGGVEIRTMVAHDPTTGRWWRDGTVQPQLAGAVDVDLGFTPSTNTLPIRRLDLALGAAAPVRAAWLRFPELTLEPLEQVYRRVSAERYDYESGDGQFRAILSVDRHGLVTRYGDTWIALWPGPSA